MSYDQTTSPLLFKIWTFILFFNLQISAHLTAMRRMFISLTLRSFRQRHFLNCQILTRQNLTHQNLTRQNLMRRNLAKKRVFTRQNLAGIRQ
ncbi:hypothetical protein D9G05_21855 [Escherichia coli]|nr:hypothetical protein [Escherichia coli]